MTRHYNKKQGTNKVEIVRQKLEKDGYITKQWARENKISLASCIYWLKNGGYKFDTELVKEGTNRNYYYHIRI